MNKKIYLLRNDFGNPEREMSRTEWILDAKLVPQILPLGITSLALNFCFKTRQLWNMVDATSASKS